MSSIMRRRIDQSPLGSHLTGVTALQRAALSIRKKGQRSSKESRHTRGSRLFGRQSPTLSTYTKGMIPARQTQKKVHPFTTFRFSSLLMPQTLASVRSWVHSRMSAKLHTIANRSPYTRAAIPTL